MLVETGDEIVGGGGTKYNHAHIYSGGGGVPVSHAKTKYIAHVPTEQYGFISAELEGTAEEAVQAYNNLKKEYAGGAGLPSREFCSFMDYYVTTGRMPDDGVEKWEAMTAEQKFIIHSIKKCFSRINKK